MFPELSIPGINLLQSSLTNQLNHIQNNGSLPFIVLRSSELPSGNYSITFSFTNYLGASSSFVKTFTKRNTTDVPTALIGSNQGFSAVDTSKLFIIKAASIQIPNCGVSIVNFFWRKISSTASNTSLIDSIPSGYLNNSILVFPQFFLQPLASYTFEVASRFTGSLNSYTTLVSFNTSIDKIFVTLPSGSFGVGNLISLIPFIRDFSYPSPLDLSIFTCSWSCIDVTNGNIACYDSNSNLIQLSGCAAQNLTGLLSIGNYTFTISVANSITGASTTGDSAAIEILSGVIPTVNIYTNERNPTSNSQTFSIMSSIGSISSSANALYCIFF